MNHISCRKHKSSKVKLSLKETREKDLASSLKAFDSEHHPVSETLLGPGRLCWNNFEQNRCM